MRNIATIAGNIGNASPAGDTLPILYLYDAIIVLESLQGKREIPIQKVITGVRKTTIRDDEMITEIIIPLLPFTKTTFVKVGGRKADAISKLSFTGAVLLEANKINDIRMVFGAVAPTMVRSKEIEAQLIGKTIEQAQELLDDILDLYQELIQPIDDQRSTKTYRKHVSLQLVMDFILNL